MKQDGKQTCSKNVQLPDVVSTAIYARTRHVVDNPPIQHERTAEVFSAYSSSRECQIWSRRDQTLLAKHLTGKYKGLLAYKSLLDGPGSTSPLCNQEPQDLQHRLNRFQTTEKLRFNLLGKESWGLYCLTKHTAQEMFRRGELSTQGHNNIFYKLSSFIIYLFN